MKQIEVAVTLPGTDQEWGVVYSLYNYNTNQEQTL